MNRIKVLREERNLSIRQVDALTNINYNSISRYENEKRDISTLMIKELSLFFEVSTDYLLGHSNSFIYALYEKGNFYIRLNEVCYRTLFNNGYISFVNNHRIIDFNRYCGINDNIDLSVLITECIRSKKYDLLIDSKDIVSVSDIIKLSGDISNVDFEYIDVEWIKKCLDK